MKDPSQLSRFTASGKTFFFNRKVARNDTEYLSINAIFGRGSHEKLTLLPSQLLEFLSHAKAAVERLLDVQVGAPAAPQAPPAAPPRERCPNCGWHLLDPSANSGDGPRLAGEDYR